MINHIKYVIDNWDPIELLASHAPDDEYHSEIDEIQQLLLTTNNSDELAQGIFNVFVNSFGEDIFKKTKEDCKEIAKTLLSKKI